ncbi:MAG: ATP-binding cassette domain-containing protein [Candidatus Lokiarchaeota archaeon]|nr:ATP-binding cassette domain-containing protein [Candidatus Lokiarchaeota archaeon]
MSESYKNKLKDEHVLVLQDVYKIYKLGQSEVIALDNVTLNVNKGDFISIMGPSGSGKTTLLNIMGALDLPTKGKVFINNLDLEKLDDSELTKLRRNEIGFIFQFFNLIPVLSCYENIELPLIISGIKKNDRDKRINEILEKVELGRYRKHKPNELSGGQQQRVAIARALVNKPSIVLADELTGDLDSHTGEIIMDYLETLNRSENQTIVVVTHDIKVAKRTNQIYQIEDGKLVSKLKN